MPFFLNLFLREKNLFISLHPLKDKELFEEVRELKIRLRKKEKRGKKKIGKISLLFWLGS
jgi:hypothetical protein